jgi:hypothetical protein
VVRYRNGDRSCWWRVNRTDRLYGVVEELRSVSPRGSQRNLAGTAV